QQVKNAIRQEFSEVDLSRAFDLFINYTNRYLQCMNFALEQIEAKHDYTKDEAYTGFREKQDWFTSEAELKDQWRKRVKYDLLNLRLTAGDSAKVDEEKNKETLRN